MNTKIYVISALVATFALMFVVATPFVTADASKNPFGFHNGAKMHKNMGIQVGDFQGTLKITNDTDRKLLQDKVTVSLSEASQGLDVARGSIGVAVNDNGDKFLVWKLASVKENSESGIVTETITIVDAANADNTTTVTREFDHPIGVSGHEGKWSHPEMMGKFADLTPEERAAQHAQFKEMKQAFSSLSEEDRNTIMTHFKDMEKQFAGLTDEERTTKHTEIKSKIDEITGLSLDEKIAKLHEFANSLRQ